ncbi:type VII secretion integral membrane protein EccD [Parenemella sanctibonifatiensis]|uniref:Type VII secretion integral membrane protein EccD n=1 Tax=Parenemella sanctibonifatiensis TaxID=2016505 RepID=A0A255E2R1_9ACTN|nr:type VII secretion integral membrane protein EccD [Parenemella sanctibonifatiensis]
MPWPWSCFQGGRLAGQDRFGGGSAPDNRYAAAVTTSAEEDLARVTIISPTRRVDLALPGAAVLGEIMPSIVRFSGFESGNAADTVHAWVLQRVGDDPLDPYKKVSSLEIRDGETLHLRQREVAMPDVAFDDVVDAVATATNTRPSWSQQNSQKFGLVILAILGVGLPGVLLWTYPDLVTVTVTLALSVALGITAILLSRAFDKYVTSSALAWMSVALAGMGGFHIVHTTLPTQILIAASLVLLMSAAMALAAAVQPYGLLAAAAGSLIVVIMTMVMVLMPNRVVEVAAVTTVVLLATTPWLTGLCYQLAQIAMPNLPSTAEALMADDEPVQSDIVVRAITADKLLGSLLTATSVATAIAVVPVIQFGTLPALLMSFCVGVALVLRGRAFVGFTQRLVLLATGSFVGIYTLIEYGLSMDSVMTRLAAGLIIVVIGCALLIAYAASWHGKILSPVWGRWGDVFEWLSVIAVIPLLLWVLDLYSWAYGLAG